MDRGSGFDLAPSFTSAGSASWGIAVSSLVASLIGASFSNSSGVGVGFSSASGAIGSTGVSKGVSSICNSSGLELSGAVGLCSADTSLLSGFCSTTSAAVSAVSGWTGSVDSAG